MPGDGTVAVLNGGTMTQGTGPVRRDLWAEQDLRPQTPALTPEPGLQRAVTPSTELDDAPDGTHTRIESDILEDTAARPRRRLARTTKLVGAGLALALLGTAAWALTRDDGPAPPPVPPAPTAAPVDLATILASLATSTSPEGEPILGTVDTLMTIDPRRADLPQPTPPAAVTLPVASNLWEASAADLLGAAASDADVPLTDLTRLRLDPVRTSVTVAQPTAATTVAVVRRGNLANSSWRALVDTVPSLTSDGYPEGAILVGLDVADGTPRWTAYLPTSSASPCQLLDVGTRMACDAEHLNGSSYLDRNLLVIDTATGSVETTLFRNVECSVTEAAQHKGVLYWVGHGPDVSCLGSGATLLAQWSAPSLPTLDVTTDDRVLVRSPERTYVLGHEGRWDSFTGTVEPGPDGTLLRTFARADLADLGPLALRETSDVLGGGVATPYVTLVTAADGRTIGALPGAAWARPDLVTRTSLATPDALEGRSGVGNWIVSASGERERLVHAGRARFDGGSPIQVTEAGVVGTWDMTSQGAPAAAPDGAAVLVVADDGRPRAYTTPWGQSYGGGRIGLSDDTSAPGPPPYALAPPVQDRAEPVSVVVTGADGTTSAFEFTRDPDPRTTPGAQPPLWVATGGVVVVAMQPGHLIAVG